MKRLTRNAAKTKREIIEKSAPVFNVHGYAGTKMQMLVDATGYQMGGIYRHFETKMDVAKAAFQYNIETIVKPNFDFEDKASPKEKIIAIFQNYKKMVRRPRIPGGCPILNTATEVDNTNEDFRQFAKSFADEYISEMAKILEEGKSLGEVKDTIDSKKEAQYIFASIEGAILLSSLTQNLEAFFTVTDRSLSYLEEKVFN